jgi:hypothetical protein
MPRPLASAKRLPRLAGRPDWGIAPKPIDRQSRGFAGAMTGRAMFGRPPRSLKRGGAMTSLQRRHFQQMKRLGVSHVSRRFGEG